MSLRIRINYHFTRFHNQVVSISISVFDHIIVQCEMTFIRYFTTHSSHTIKYIELRKMFHINIKIKYVISLSLVFSTVQNNVYGYRYIEKY